MQGNVDEITPGKEIAQSGLIVLWNKNE